MTVSLALSCRWDDIPTVICASDRMLTFGDIEYDSHSFKIFLLTNSIVMLIAGDAAVQMEILNGVRIDIGQRLSRDQSWMWVQEVANTVGHHTAAFFRARVERRILEPFGMNMPSFLDKQDGFHPRFLVGLLQKMQEARPDVETLVAGVDPAGAHIYAVDYEGELVNHDAVGFAAIGAGRRHAESQFMFAKHAPWKNFPESLLLAYTAKRRAEVAPGVGEGTDACFIRGLGGFQWLNADNIDYLKVLYTDIQRQNTLVNFAANRRIADDFEKVAEAAKQVQEAAKASAQEPPATPSLAPPEESIDSPAPPGPMDDSSGQPPSRA